MQQVPSGPVIGDPRLRAVVLALVNDREIELTWQHARELFVAAFDSNEQQSAAS